MASVNAQNGKPRHFCSVCSVAFNSDAEVAIHEFSKIHCDNLLRVSKNQPVKRKIAKPTPSTSSTNDHKPNTAVIEPSPTVNIALYGYFDPSKPNEAQPKEFNTEYDPYLQKLADDPYKIKEEDPIAPTTNVTRFEISKKKKKRRTCAICNIDCLNIPDYDAHMKSPKHIWKLKMSGMGVSAHFVKAGADLHTTDKVAEGEGNEKKNESTPAGEVAPVPMSLNELYCDVCHLLLPTISKYNEHMAGRAHMENLKKCNKTKVVEAPSAGQLFCYTCKLPLNNIAQYNDHKKGKKHKIKCRQLIREGLTIPPDERPPDMPWHGPRPNQQIIYPEMYQEFLDKQSEKEAAKLMPPPPPVATPVKPVIPPVNTSTGMYHCPHCSDRFNTSSKLEVHMKTHKNLPVSSATTAIQPAAPKKAETSKEERERRKEEKAAGTKKVDAGFTCSICEETFCNQPPFEMHLNSEEHALKIFEVKKGGMNSKEILAKLMNDRRVVRSDCYGRHCCGICAVISHTPSEVEQHQKSIVHKYTDKDYSKKRLIEIQQSMAPGEDGNYDCRFCHQTFSLLTSYNSHLHSSVHRDIVWKDHIKKSYIHRWLGFPKKQPWTIKSPGVRTKIPGTAKDLKSGIVHPIPNLETVEPIIDKKKNADVDAMPETEEEKKKKKVKKLKRPKIMAVRKLPGMIYRRVPPPLVLRRPPAFRPRPLLPPEQRSMYPREAFLPFLPEVHHRPPPPRQIGPRFYPPPMGGYPPRDPRLMRPRAPVRYNPYPPPHSYGSPRPRARAPSPYMQQYYENFFNQRPPAWSEF